MFPGNGFSRAFDAVPHGGAKCAEAILPWVAMSSKTSKSLSLVRSRIWIATPVFRLVLKSIACTKRPLRLTASERLPLPAKTSRKINSFDETLKFIGRKFGSEQRQQKLKFHMSTSSMSGNVKVDSGSSAFVILLALGPRIPHGCRTEPLLCHSSDLDFGQSG